MTASSYARILAGRPAVDFVGRDAETARLLAHAHSTSSGLLVLTAPGAGASELLRQTYDRLFHENHDAIPFYFTIRPSLGSAREIAESYLKEFIRQLVAYRRREPSIMRSMASLDELAELSLSVSGIWIDRLIATAQKASDGRDLIRTCLGAPLRAAAHEAKTVVMIDDLHLVNEVEGGAIVLDELSDLFTHAGVPFVFSGYRRFLFGRVDAPRMELDNLEFPAAGKLVEVFAKEAGIPVSEQSRDLLAVQTNGNPSRLRHLIRTAQDTGAVLDSFESVEKIYTDALLGGRIAIEFDRTFSRACGSPERERRVTGVLAQMQASESARLEIELFRRRLMLDEAATGPLLERLSVNELVRLSPAHVEAVTDDVVLADYIATRDRLARSESRAAVFGETMTRFIKRAPELMAKIYRADAAIGVRQVLGAFDGRQVPTSLLDYREFRDELKGLVDAEAYQKAVDSGSKTRLPRIFFTTAASNFYAPLVKIAEAEHAAIALGFEARDDDPNCEIVWIAAEIQSRLEASREVAEFWCDRLEAAAVMCDFQAFRLWLISPEGFTTDALDLLKRRNAYGSSRRQVSLLRRFLNAPPAASDALAANEYEIVIPMDADAELIAAHSVEEIARRHNLDSKSINQIKTALVEACINASEHSLSPDRKIYQRFRVEDDRVVLTVSNRGLRLASHAVGEPSQEGRRGWGLRLMRNLMDEVSIEEVDDGTRIVMTKFTSAPRAA